MPAIAHEIRTMEFLGRMALASDAIWIAGLVSFGAQCADVADGHSDNQSRCGDHDGLDCGLDQWVHWLHGVMFAILGLVLG